MRFNTFNGAVVADDTELVRARKRRIQQMFNAIAGRYDLLNHLLSGGVDLYWRRRALASVRRRGPARVLDLATGTGDFARAAGRLAPGRVVGVDVAIDMVRIARTKLGGAGATGPVVMAGDAEMLPFRDRCFDLVTVAFGARNFGSLGAGLAEAERVLRPGGEVIVLEFTEPTLPGFRQLYGFYFHRVLPLVGGLISGNREAYSYLPRSVGSFPQGKGFLEEMEAAGFTDTKATALTLGICAVYQGRKSD